MCRNFFVLLPNAISQNCVLKVLPYYCCYSASSYSTYAVITTTVRWSFIETYYTQFYIRTLFKSVLVALCVYTCVAIPTRKIYTAKIKYLSPENLNFITTKIITHTVSYSRDLSQGILDLSKYSDLLSLRLNFLNR